MGEVGLFGFPTYWRHKTAWRQTVIGGLKGEGVLDILLLNDMAKLGRELLLCLIEHFSSNGYPMLALLPAESDHITFFKCEKNR
jgi:hypothetical protein